MRMSSSQDISAYNRKKTICGSLEWQSRASEMKTFVFVG
jgi:hypothetical protein